MEPFVTNGRPIGVIDSGIGGFSVVKAVQQMLPGEDLVYFGDGANTPYGNYDACAILNMTRYMLEFMRGQQIKLLLVACNTISCLIPEFEGEMDCPVLSVVQAGAQAAARVPQRRIGVVSTCFTHSTGCYPRAIRELAPEKEVVSYGCANLARLVETRLGVPEGQRELTEELRQDFLRLVTVDEVDVCLLGCTHFPLVEDQIRGLYPGLELLDPAREMVRMARERLGQEGLAAEAGREGGLWIYTTADPRDYREKADRVGLTHIRDVAHYPPKRP